VGDDDEVLLGLKAVLHDEGAIGVGHFEAVDHHDCTDGHPHSRTSQPEHLRDVGILKKELAGRSLYSLSKVPPVTRIRMAMAKIVRGEPKLAFWRAYRNPHGMPDVGDQKSETG
jgi:hypothetical protein